MEKHHWEDKISQNRNKRNITTQNLSLSSALHTNKRYFIHKQIVMISGLIWPKTKWWETPDTLFHSTIFFVNEHIELWSRRIIFWLLSMIYGFYQFTIPTKYLSRRNNDKALKRDTTNHINWRWCDNTTVT